MAQYTIRVPDELDERIRTAAAEDRRSKNGEIEWLLETALLARQQVRDAAPRATENTQ